MAYGKALVSLVIPANMLPSHTLSSLELSAVLFWRELSRLDSESELGDSWAKFATTI